MKIWGNIPQVSGVYNKVKGLDRTQGAKQTQTKKDSISISEQAKDFQTVLKSLKDVPDVRTDLVEKLSDRYDKGEYHIEADKVSENIIKKLLET